MAVNAPRRKTRAESAAETRQRLLDVAGAVFEEVGFNAATIEAVVLRAGYTRGAFYAHFADKTDLFLTMLERQRASEFEHVQQLLAEADDAETPAVIQTWFDSLPKANRWELAYAELWPQAVRNPALRKRLAARHTQMRDTIADMIDQHCKATGLEPPIPTEQIAVMMLAIGDGISHQRHLDEKVLPPDAFATAVMYLWAGLLSGVTPTARS